MFDFYYLDQHFSQIYNQTITGNGIGFSSSSMVVHPPVILFQIMEENSPIFCSHFLGVMKALLFTLFMYTGQESTHNINHIEGYNFDVPNYRNNLVKFQGTDLTENMENWFVEVPPRSPRLWFQMELKITSKYGGVINLSVKKVNTIDIFSGRK